VVTLAAAVILWGRAAWMGFTLILLLVTLAGSVSRIAGTRRAKTGVV
jgi:hypothetical protein